MAKSIKWKLSIQFISQAKTLKFSKLSALALFWLYFLKDICIPLFCSPPAPPPAWHPQRDIYLASALTAMAAGEQVSEPPQALAGTSSITAIPQQESRVKCLDT